MTASASFYRLDTGLLTGRTWVGDAQMLAADTPEGCGAVAGTHDHLSTRVDLKTGQVVDWQPPAPPDDALQTWRWDTTRRRWCAQPTDEAVRRARRAELVQRIEAMERAQARPLRLLGIDPTDATARARLLGIEQDIAALRAEMP